MSLQDQKVGDTVLRCFVDAKTHARLQQAAKELGRDITDLAESAISEAALAFEKDMQRRASGQESLPFVEG